MVKNDKGIITWIFTLMTLILSLGFVAATWGTFINNLTNISSDVDVVGYIFWGLAALVLLMFSVYLWWHGIMILLGIGQNTWTFVIVAFIGAAIIGGILMLIAKLIN